MSGWNRAKRLLKRSRTAAIATRIAAQRRSQLRALLNRAAIGATHRNLDLDESLGYIDDVFNDYVAYGGLSSGDLRGAQVLEVGAGDNFGVALRFLAAGAERVVAVDRFATWRDPAQQRGIYAAQFERMSVAERRLVGAAVTLDGDPEFDPARLDVVEGIPIEEAHEHLETAAFDLVVSRAVLEHVYDVSASFRAMDLLLKPGGAMLHKVDLSDHGYFTEGGHHPLTILTVSDRVYRWMGGEAGLPNRERKGAYVHALEQLGYAPRVLITHVIGRDAEIDPHTEALAEDDRRAGEALAEAIRPRLERRFRDLPADELAVTGIFLAARKPVSRNPR